MNLRFRLWMSFLIIAAIIMAIRLVEQQTSMLYGSVAGQPYLSRSSFDVLATPTMYDFFPESSAEAGPQPESSAEVVSAAVDRELYSPARYGLPDLLNGMEVVAVVSHDQNPCIPAGQLLVMIYIDELVEPSSLTGALTSAGAELRAINPNAILVSAGPMEDRDAFFTNLDRDNRARAGRCGEVFGGPSGVSGDREVLFATPTPDTSFLNVNPESSAEVQPVDRSQYAPERYGLPKILGGFEVVAVVGGDTNPCTPADAIIVYLQGVDATYKDYQQGDTPENASMALEELVKLYPKAAISIGSPIEDMEAFFRVLEEQKIYGEQAMARGGCEPLGGPIILDPTYETVEAPVSEPFQMIVTATPMK